MPFDINSVRHPKEKVYGPATLVAGSILWLLLLASFFLEEEPIIAFVVIGVYALLIWGMSAAVRALIRAHMFGHYVMVSPQQFPHIHAMVEKGAKSLGLGEVPMTFVYNSNGIMNAFALRLIGRRRYVWLTSALIDADNEEQLRFVIGHELGHHLAGHLNQFPNLLRWPAMIVPFLGAAYSRSRELTCDRIGALIVHDIDVARSALQMLACGSAKLNVQMNGQAFAEQEKLVPPVAGFLLKIFSGYPRLTKRVEEVAKWLESQGSLRPSVQAHAVAA
jgi:Zn-dependent protease with chaperone function